MFCKSNDARRKRAHARRPEKHPDRKPTKKRKRREIKLLGGLAAGVIGGIVATWVLDRYQEGALEATRRRENTTGTAPIVRYAIGAVAGGAYGLAVEFLPVVRRGYGTGYSNLLFLGGSEAALPWFNSDRFNAALARNFNPPPAAFPHRSSMALSRNHAPRPALAPLKTTGRVASRSGAPHLAFRDLRCGLPQQIRPAHKAGLSNRSSIRKLLRLLRRLVCLVRFVRGLFLLVRGFVLVLRRLPRGLVRLLVVLQFLLLPLFLLLVFLLRMRLRIRHLPVLIRLLGKQHRRPRHRHPDPHTQTKCRSRNPSPVLHSLILRVFLANLIGGMPAAQYQSWQGEWKAARCTGRIFYNGNRDPEWPQ